ncbi:MAG: bifunctional phosphoglucose/phosphomannose isomerase [Patescibacteria group bacterium]
MAMDKTIRDFPKQFEYEPAIENAGKLKPKNKFIVCGMGGSHLAADLLKVYNPSLDLIIHSDYGLPALAAEELNERLVIVNSYSGNTEEAMDSFCSALEKKLSTVAVSTGGKLLEQAEAHGVPFVRIPDTGIQPRSATGFSLRALLKLMGDEQALADTQKLSKILGADSEDVGQNLASKLEGHIPIIYAPSRNQALAQNWKVRFNETAKIPAFYNVFPELNHNEMTGFDIAEKTKSLSEKFSLIFLRDPDDDQRIVKRMDMTKKILESRGLGVEEVKMPGASIWHKIFATLLIADWTAYYLALHYGVDPKNVPMVEEFKKLIA